MLLILRNLIIVQVTETTYSASHFMFDISSDGKMFTGIDISVHFLVGFHIKIGVEEKYE